MEQAGNIIDINNFISNAGSNVKLFCDQPDVMNVTQMSSALGVSTKTGYSMLRSGRIPFVKVGRSYRISKIKLIAFLENSSVQ